MSFTINRVLSSNGSVFQHYISIHIRLSSMVCEVPCRAQKRTIRSHKTFFNIHPNDSFSHKILWHLNTNCFTRTLVKPYHQKWKINGPLYVSQTTQSYRINSSALTHPHPQPTENMCNENFPTIVPMGRVHFLFNAKVEKGTSATSC